MKEDTFFERMTAPTLYHVTTIEVDGKPMQILYQSYPYKELISIKDATDMIEILQNYINSVTQEDIDTANKQMHEQLYQAQLNYKPEPKQPVAREVYLFYSKLTKQHKIGIAKSSEGRLKDFADRDVMIVTHSKKTSAALKHEQRLHKLFESYAVGHEWFDFRGDETIIQHAIEEINNIE